MLAITRNWNAGAPIKLVHAKTQTLTLIKVGRCTLETYPENTIVNSIAITAPTRPFTQALSRTASWRVIGTAGMQAAFIVIGSDYLSAKQKESLAEIAPSEHDQ